MRRCEFCGSGLPDRADFCGNCGQSVKQQPEGQTRMGSLATSHLEEDDFPTQAGISGPWWQEKQDLPPQMHPTSQLVLPSQEEEEEEERRRRAALLAMGLPLAGAGPRSLGGTPMVQGGPPVGNVPFVQGQPGAPGGIYGSASQGAGPSSPWRAGPPQTRPNPHIPQKPTPQSPPGCLVVLLVALITIILIVGGAAGAAMTFLAPGLSTLSGTSLVAPGGSLSLHGEHFLPGATVVLTLDNALPLEFSRTTPPTQSSASLGNVAGLELQGVSMALAWRPLAGSALKTRGDGTFDITITINPQWSLGQHSIHASEQLTPRNASLTFTIQQPGTGNTTPTPGVTPSVTDTPAATATVSPTATGSGLSCVNPTTLTLGPVSEGYNQPITQNVSLCANGSTVVNWSASWNANEASWLQLPTTSGQIQAPGQQQVAISANPKGIKAGSYTTTVTFANGQGGPSVTLNVTFVVQVACLSASPNKLSFSGTAGLQDPAPQTFTLVNCGGLENWNATLQLQTTQQWLSLSATNGTLNNQGTKSLSASVQIVSTKLGPGTYTGKILFISGSSLLTMTVTLTVNAAPQIVLFTPQPPSYNANQQCTFDAQAKNWICLASIGGARTNPGNLTWNASSTGINGITFTPAQGTLTPGQTTRVRITVPQNNCKTPATLVFTGPGNTIQITWNCTPPVPIG